MAEPNEVKDEAIVEDTAVETPELSPTEQQASRHGWVPKEEWKGNPDEWRPAREFVERGEMIGKILAQGRELQDLKSAVQFMSEAQRKQYAAGYANAVADLKKQRDAALDEGDLKQAQQLNDKIADIKDQQKVAVAQVAQPATPTGPSYQFNQWHGSNSWYGADKVLTKLADSLGLTFKEENPNSTEADMLQYVEKTVKKEMPHKFQSGSAPNPDGEGRSSRSSSGRSTYSSVEKEMTTDQKKIMDTILKSTKMTKEQYLKDFAG
jgi:hypothetical protein